MRFFKEKCARLKIPWNEKPLTENDFYRLCKRHKVKALEYPLASTEGFYYFAYGKDYIVVDPRLEPGEKLFVMFHEFAHFLMHIPEYGATASFHRVGKQTREESEADAFALCALMPKQMIQTRSARQLVDEDGFDERRVRERLELFRLRGI